MSVDDGLVMQLHCGSLRNHNGQIYAAYGPDRGFDIPVAAEYTRNLLPLLDRFGNHPGLTIILFTLDEAAYRASWPRWPAPILPCGLARPGGSLTRGTGSAVTSTR